MNVQRKTERHSVSVRLFCGVFLRLRLWIVGRGVVGLNNNGVWFEVAVVVLSSGPAMVDVIQLLWCVALSLFSLKLVARRTLFEINYLSYTCFQNVTVIILVTNIMNNDI